MKFEELTLDEIKDLLGKRLAYEMEDTTQLMREINSALGQENSEFERKALMMMARRLGEVVAERLIYMDVSPIESEDFEKTVEEMILNLEPFLEPELRERLPDGLRGYLKIFFPLVIQTINVSTDDNPYLSYRFWLDAFLAIAGERSLAIKEIKVDDEICDEILRRKVTLEEYRADKQAEIDDSTNVESLVDQVLKPSIESQLRELGYPEDQIGKLTEKIIAEALPGQIEKMEKKRKLLEAGMQKKIKRIFG